MAPRWPGTALLTTKAPRKLVFLFTLSLSVTYLFYSLLSCYSSLQFPLQEAGIYLQPESQISPVDAIRTASLQPEGRDSSLLPASIRSPEPGASSLPERSAFVSPSVQSVPSLRSIQRSIERASPFPSARISPQLPTLRTREPLLHRVPQRLLTSAGATQDLGAPSSTTIESVSSLDNTFIASVGGDRTSDSTDTEKDFSTRITVTERAIGDTIISDIQGFNTLDGAINDWRFNSLDSANNKYNDRQFNSLERAIQQFNSLDSSSIKDIQHRFNSLDSPPIKDTDHRFNSLDSPHIKGTDRQFNSLDSPPIKDIQHRFNSLDSPPIKDIQHRFNSLDSPPVKDTDHRFNSLDITDIKGTNHQFNSLDSSVIQNTDHRLTSLDSPPVTDTEHRFSSLDSTDLPVNSQDSSPIKDTHQQFNSLVSTPIKDTDHRFYSLESAFVGDTDHRFSSLDNTHIKDNNRGFNSLDRADQQFNSLDSAPIKETDGGFNSLDRADRIYRTTIKITNHRFNSLDSAPVSNLKFNSKDSTPIKETEQWITSLESTPGQHFNSLDRADERSHLRFNSLDSASVKDPDQRVSSSDQDASLSTSQIIGAPITFNKQGFSSSVIETARRFSTWDSANSLTGSQGISTVDSAPIRAPFPFSTSDSSPIRAPYSFSTSDSDPIRAHYPFSTSDSDPSNITDRRLRTSDNSPLVYTDERSNTLDRSLVQSYNGVTSPDTIPSLDLKSSTPDKVPIQPTDLRFRTSDHSPKTQPLLWGLGKNQDGGQTTPSTILATPLSDFGTAEGVSYSGPWQNYQHVRDIGSEEVRVVSDFTGDEMRPPLYGALDWEKAPMAATDINPPSHIGYLERDAQESSTTDEELSRRITINSTVEYGDKRLPQAIIIGVKKGGTRALLEALRAHPDVRAVGVEPHFFDRNYEKGLEWYRDLMPRTIEGQITMEKTPSYFVTNDAPQRIHSMAKDTKLIVVVRNPVTRAISDYTQTLSKKPEIPTFEVLAFKNRTLGLIDASWSALRIGIYALHLESWMQYFPLSQILFVSGEGLITNPAEELAKVQEFLGLQRIITEKYFHFNKTKGFPCLKKPEDTGAPRCLGKSKGRTHPKIDPDVIQRLRKFYKPFNAMFYQMTGQDFQWEKEELEG